MAMIDVGGAGRRALNRELTLVPFIDFLLCIVAFLLVTAVWSRMARLEAQASAPGVAGPDAPVSRGELHVDMRKDDRFLLEWRHGSTIVFQSEVARKNVENAQNGEAIVRYPALATEVQRVWAKEGAHRAPDDLVHDRAVLHASNTAAFEEIVAGMDAIRATSRADRRGNPAPAFDVIFAVD